MHKEIATLAAGCFWGVEELIRNLPGVIATEVGYTAGSLENPIYEKVKTGVTGHAEAIQIHFDADQISFEQLLLFFFKIHDPTTLNRQGNDVGSQYRSAIFYHSDDQKKSAEAIKQRVAESKAWPGEIVTEILPVEKFYNAEGYHQDYLQKNPGGYTCHFIRKINI
jgi:peptide-methionine (S)-S-oxide reductase